VSDSTSADVDQRVVEIFSDNRTAAVPLRWSRQPGPTGDYWISLDGPNGTIEAVDRDLFEALIIVRNELHAQGWRIAVQGARRDTWASGMIRNMVGAARVYVLEFGRPIDRPYLVPIFAPANPADIGTPEEQRANYFAWRESVRR
jgi:hypothetical protein